jgi:hypothetical protein
VTRGLVVFIVVAISLLQAVSAVAFGADRRAPSKVIDATFRCSIEPRAGLTLITTSARSGFRDPTKSARWRYLSASSVGSRDGYLVSVSAGSPLVSDPGVPPISRWLYVEGTHCRRVSAQVTLSSSRLDGGVASQLPGTTQVGYDAFECATTRAVLVRLRATFRTPTRLRVVRGAWTTSTAAVVRTAEVAVRTSAGKELSYSTVSEAGTATLFTARSCVRD